MCLLNIWSLRNKTADFVDYICETKVDLCAITETWLCPSDDAIRNESCPGGYVLADHSRTGRRGGGTALVYRNSLTVKKIDAGEKTSFEFSEWTVQSASHNLRIIVIYRPPYSNEHRVAMSTFFAEFADYVETILSSNEQLLILGDFNIHIDVAGDSDANKLSDFFESVGLQQHVEQYTHVQGHTLDLVISRRSDNIIEDSPCVDRFLSDHGTVLFSLKSTKPSLLEKTISYRKLKSIDMNSFQSDLAATDLCRNPPEALEDLAKCYNGTLKVVLDKHAPLITRSIKERPRVPWLNEEIKMAKRERRKAEKRWRRTKLDSDLAAFKVKRNATTALMNKARWEFYTNFIEEHSKDQKKLFAASNRLLNRGSVNCLPPTIDKAQFAEDIGKFFVQKIVNIRSRLNGHGAIGSHKPDTEDTESSFVHLTEFEMLTEQDVKSLMQHSSLKSCVLNPMPSTLVSRCDVLLPVLTRLINMSLKSGQFPVAWKEALVLPLLKKPGLDILFKNFCPVSNLPFVSKLTESAVYNQTHSHICRNNLYPANQSSYRKNYSTETALLRVKNDILLNMNKQHVTLLVLLDLSAAFDTVDHNVLLTRLHSKFGISGTALEWFSSYLSGRSQRVMVQGNLSQSLILDFGVPQGSCLGPLLFTIYASKLFDVIKGHLPTVHCYADDTQLYVSFSPNKNTGQYEAVNAIQHCVDDIRNWMTNDKLLLNDEKTEFLMIGTKPQRAKVNIDHILIGDSVIRPKGVVKNLGTWLDSTLSMNFHVNNICSNAFYYLYNIRRIRKYLSRRSTETLIHAFVSSRVDYCNSLLYGLPAYQLNKLQRVQNTAARLIFQESKYCHVRSLLYNLHWLPVKFRIDFKILLLTYKAINGLAPFYLQELISLKEACKYKLRSDCDGLLLNPVKFKTLTTLGDRSFAGSAPKLWNSLPYQE